jgi:hypothetical protein
VIKLSVVLPAVITALGMFMVDLPAVSFSVFIFHFFEPSYRYHPIVSRHHRLFPTIPLKMGGFTWCKSVFNG